MIMKLEIIKDLALMDDQDTFCRRPKGSGDEGSKEKRFDGSSTCLIQKALASVLTIPNHPKDEQRDSAEKAL